MQFRTSIPSVRATLLAAMSFGALPGCGGTTIDRTLPTTDAGANGGAAGAGGSASMPCDSPAPLRSSQTGMGPTGGYVRCADGTVRRTHVDDCWSSIDPAGGPTLVGPAWPDGSVTYGCRTNADCTAAPHGHCDVSQSYGFGGAPSVSCVYGCVRDSECASGQICLCGDPVGSCVDARCASAADCSNGTPCMMGNVLGVCGPPTVHFTCGPLCVKDADCDQQGGFHMTCQGGDCHPGAVCGRPFIVGREHRTAGVELRNDWRAALSPDVTQLPPDVRRALAEHYTAIGLMEHASVAAFARFSLELLALGAPAELVRLAVEALGDETEHARLCFGLAASFGEFALGPGPLDVRGALEGTSVTEKLRIAFIEACVGETCAAVEAAEAAERATDPVVAAVLRRIATDETRHAELGWKFAKWMLGRMDVTTRGAALHDLRALVIRELGCAEGASTPSSESALLLGYGVLPPSLRFALRRATIRQAVLPCLDSLTDILLPATLDIHASPLHVAQEC